MGRTVKHAMGLATLLFVAGMFMIATASWAQGPTTAPPTVKLVGPSTLTEHLKSTKAGFTAGFKLSVENDGPMIAAKDASGLGSYQFSVVSDRDYSKAADAPTIAVNEPVALAATTVTSVPVTLTVHDSNTTALTVVLSVTAPSGIVPSTEALTLTRSPLSSNFSGILVGSLIVGAGVAVLAFIFRHEPEPLDETGMIYTEATFSFSQSWATSITAVLTVVATVFSATGVLTSLVPGIDTGFFLAVNVVYAVVLTLAPLVYSTFQKTDGSHVYGTRHGFAIAATVTAVAVGGQLSTIGAVVWLSDLNSGLRVAFLLLLGLVAVLVIAYTEATRRQLWHLPKPAANAPTRTTLMAALP